MLSGLKGCRLWRASEMDGKVKKNGAEHRRPRSNTSDSDWLRQPSVNFSVWIQPIERSLNADAFPLAYRFSNVIHLFCSTKKSMQPLFYANTLKKTKKKHHNFRESYDDSNRYLTITNITLMIIELRGSWKTLQEVGLIWTSLPWMTKNTLCIMIHFPVTITFFCGFAPNVDLYAYIPSAVTSSTQYYIKFNYIICFINEKKVNISFND